MAFPWTSSTGFINTHAYTNTDRHIFTVSTLAFKTHAGESQISRIPSFLFVCSSATEHYINILITVFVYY